MTRRIPHTQHHDGEDLTFQEGVEATAITYVEQPLGFRVQIVLPAGFTPTSYRVESGVLLTEGGTFVQDFAGPFDGTQPRSCPSRRRDASRSARIRRSAVDRACRTP